MGQETSKQFGSEFGENFASGAGEQLALGVGESTIWLGGSIIAASQWHGAYRVIANTSIGGRRLWAACALPSVTTAALMAYAVRTHAWQPVKGNKSTNKPRSDAKDSKQLEMTRKHMLQHQGKQMKAQHDYMVERQQQPDLPAADDPDAHQETGEAEQKWYLRWLFGKKPSDGSVERGESLNASGLGATERQWSYEHEDRKG